MEVESSRLGFGLARLQTLMLQILQQQEFPHLGRGLP